MATTPTTSYRVNIEHRTLVARIVSWLRENPEKAAELSEWMDSAISNTRATQSQYESLEQRIIELQACYKSDIERATSAAQSQYELLGQRVIAIQKHPAGTPKTVIVRREAGTWPTSDELTAGLGTRLKAARIAKGLSIRGLEASSGVSNASICRFETGKRAPSDEQLAALEAALGIDLGRDAQIQMIE